MDNSKQAVAKVIKGFKKAMSNLNSLNSQTVISKNIPTKTMEIKETRLSPTEDEAKKEATYISKLKKDGKLQTPDEIKKALRDILYTEVISVLEKGVQAVINQEITKK